MARNPLVRNNYIFFPKIRENYSICCYYSPSLPEEIAKFCFTAEECDKIISLWDENSSMEARTHKDKEGESADKTVRKSKLNWLSFNNNTAWIFEKISKVVMDANLSRFNFDLAGFFEDLQLTRYDGDGGHYEWHEDGGNGPSSVRKISVVIQLSDPENYSGGELEVFGFGKLTKERGSVSIFPSYALHKVHPTTSGTRFSLVSWISGPAFR
jgi:PKHD-type hydroxylase